ncbi:MAG: Ribosomal protein S12p Asp88 methylthiotransferase [Clostridiales bacterium 38_11]|nr:MAG: Ribosomal protein S12p Asp88 methylthiotransferase [Clostridiales bacterium 38_11]HBH13131.1 30S ribosomal protein S12 methylthiotransferase RimO [Clostridiales bacterium]
MEKIHIITLGCSKNTVDTEYMLGLLQSEYTITSNIEDSDVVIINTCTFINDAKEESIEAIFDVVKLKKDGIIKTIVLAGCLSQRYADELVQEIPEIDMFIGTSNYDEIVDILKKESKVNIEDPSREIAEHIPRVLTESDYYAYVKVSEGCDNRCTYCIIPSVRGRHRSRSIKNILEEVIALTKQGISEIIIIAQDTSKYGTDLYGKKMLHKLLKEISCIPDVKWIRVHYIYPEDFYDELLDEFALNNKLLNYFEIPIQHINDTLLKRMNRKTNRADIIDLISRIRAKIPDAIIRTTLIVGFPGETEKQYLELKQFVENYRFDRLGVFAYSEEEDTPAYKLPHKIPEGIKERRRDEIMLIQQDITFKKNNQLKGTSIECIVDSLINGNQYLGRTYMDSPDIDSVIYFESLSKLESGDVVTVKILDYMEYDLIGVHDESSK